ncbi:MAG TPA: aminotransferase class I/II-fold pyridoxal phosphate-dependent enzyme [Gammaproteobacteria bacterium]|jgi:aromatic-L-amino-acid decarboxylase|nr:aminotransferase class I/II-fold pyridoxal phosphate-dependent enzyme [Gammaproteobacteria bacterium]
MNKEEFRRHAHQLIDWIADYQTNVENYPVKSTCKPGDIIAQLPASAPVDGESFENIFADFENTILPGVTHWQHPAFFAYYPANTSPPSILAETLMSALGVQGMSWQTSPAATELEERVMQWLVELLGLPNNFTGVIQDSASNSALCSIITAREAASDFDVNQHGLYQQKPFTLYCSAEAHSSIEKAVKIAGLGSANLRKIPVDENFAMKTDNLLAAIEKDIADGLCPLWVAAALGTTGSTAFDPLRRIGEISEKYNLWLHVDAAYAGTAFILPEFRYLADGMEYVDSFVFNPHKWMLTNFDCSAYFVRDKNLLVNTFSILPEYLKTREDTQVNNYRDWGPTLARRFRALKLWFVLRSYGQDSLRNLIKSHIELAQDLMITMQNTPGFEIMAPNVLNNICFRYHPQNINDQEKLNQLNLQLMETLNATGKLYLTHTKLNGNIVLRMVIAQTNVNREHVDKAWEQIQHTATHLPL